MNIKRASIAGVFIAVGSLLACGIAGRILKLDLAKADPRTLPAAMWIVALVSTPILVALGARWYFKSPRMAPSAKSGAALGALYTVAGIVFDSIALAPHPNGLRILLGYFAMPWYWTAFVLILGTCTFVGHAMRRKAPREAARAA